MNLSPAYEKWKEETIAESGKATAMTIARNMLREGAAIAFIAKVTGLSVAEIEQSRIETAE
jgi:predicted transposase YdaD